MRFCCCISNGVCNCLAFTASYNLPHEMMISAENEKCGKARGEKRERKENRQKSIAFCPPTQYKMVKNIFDFILGVFTTKSDNRIQFVSILFRIIFYSFLSFFVFFLFFFSFFFFRLYCTFWMAYCRCRCVAVILTFEQKRIQR